MKNVLLLASVLLTLAISPIVMMAQTPAAGNNHRFHSSVPVKAGSETGKPSSATLSTFEKLKLLVGDWEARDGTAYGGKPIRISYKVVSNGTSVMETYYQVGSDFIDMVTLYHLDGDSLMLTHFCAVNNQVRLRADPMTGEDKVLRFNYIDASNLSASSKDVMNKLEITFTDNDHLTQVWTWRMTNDKGNTSDEKAVYNFVRRK